MSPASRSKRRGSQLPAASPSLEAQTERRLEDEFGALVEPRYIERGTRAYRSTMLALFSAGFATFALLYCVQPLMPVLSDAFAIDAARSSLVLSVSTATLALGLLVTGPISDAVGRKQVMSVSLLAAALFTLLGAPYGYSQSVVGLISVVYLSGIYSSAWGGALADRLGRPRVFWWFVALMLAGLALTLSTPIVVVFAGVLLFTFGFFAAHSTASSWVGKRAPVARAQASSLYLFNYYLGSSLAGTSGGFFWHLAGWPGVAGFIAALLLVALLVAWFKLHALREGV